MRSSINVCGLQIMLTKNQSPIILYSVKYLFRLFMERFVTILAYAFFASQNPRLHARGMWMFFFVIAAPISTLIYWFLFVWPAPRSRRLVKTLYPG